MSHLAISLFGAYQVSLDGQALTSFETEKTRALLAYLAVEAQRSHRREFLAALFWPENPPSTARANLRQTLYRLRIALGEPSSPAGNAFLLVSPHEIRFNPDCQHWLDVSALNRLVSESQSHHPHGLSLCPACLEGLQSAVELYQGGFLESLALPDCPRFDYWWLARQELYHRQMLAVLARLADFWDDRRDYARASHFAQKEIQLEPWRESAHRRLMRALALNGQRAEALHQYQTCSTILAGELGIGPSPQTKQLYELIRDDRLPGDSISDPAVSNLGQSDHTPAPPTVLRGAFVARQPQLDQLNQFLEAALSGQGYVAFVTGEAGSGKSSLLAEFAHQAQNAHGDLLVAEGAGVAQAGLGDPYLPFRDILAMLCGQQGSFGLAQVISKENSQRLRSARPAILQALVEDGPDLVGTLLPGAMLANQASRLETQHSQVHDQLHTLLERQTAGTTVPSGGPKYDQIALFDQVSRLLLGLSQRYPLLLVLDDLQWADRGSISLLFHLGRRLAGSRILVAGAYRPEEVASGRGDERHPLEPVVNELQALYGQNQVDLSQIDGLSFVQAYLDSEPNHLDQAFREMLHHQTGGHALFTVELLRGMQERNQLQQDETGCWAVASPIDWGLLPARVEAVIAERFQRISPECQVLLAAASVQGETFAAELLARTLELDEAQVIKRLSGELNKQQHLVQVQEIDQIGERPMTRYRFRHFLYQAYLYNSLDEVERARLHRATAGALETLFGSLAGQLSAPEASAPRLAWHCEQAGMLEKAVDYLLVAGRQAYQLSANEEAILHLKRGLDLLHRLPESPDHSQLEQTLLLSLSAPLNATRGYADPELGRIYARAYELAQESGQAGLITPVLFSLWSLYATQARYRQAFEVALELEQLSLQQQDSYYSNHYHFSIGTLHHYFGQFASAQEHLQFISISQDTHLSVDTPHPDRNISLFSLTFLSNALWFLGYPQQAYLCAQELLARTQATDHDYNLAFTMGMGPCVVYHLRREYLLLQTHADSLLKLSTENRFGVYMGWARIFLGRAQIEQRLYQPGLDNINQGLDEYRATGHRNSLTLLLGILAEAYGLAGESEQGLNILSEALSLVHETNERFYEAELYRLQAELLLAQDELSSEESNRQAQVYLRRALFVARRQGAKSLELRAAISLARLQGEQGKDSQALALLGEIYNWFTEGFDTPDLQQARVLLGELTVYATE